jgi:hypothetical protein
MSDTPNVQIDMAAINAEVEKLAQSGQLEAEYLKLRTRQKTQQKKQQGSGAMKAYQQKKKLIEKLIREKIAAAGKADELDAAADEQAAKNHEAFLAKQAEESEDSETEAA